jgi:hypothetical protein
MSMENPLWGAPRIHGELLKLGFEVAPLRLRTTSFRDHDRIYGSVVTRTPSLAGFTIPRKCLRYLTCNPFRRWMCCDVDPDEVSAAEPDDDEQIEADGRDDNRSMAAISGAWLRKKVRHPWLGGPRRLTMYLATLDHLHPSLSFGTHTERPTRTLRPKINDEPRKNEIRDSAREQTAP